jgi:predicted peptidase
MLGCLEFSKKKAYTHKHSKKKDFNILFNAEGYLFNKQFYDVRQISLTLQFTTMKKYWHYLFAIIAFLSFSGVSFSQQISFRLSNEFKTQGLIYVPDSVVVGSSKRLPLLIFLHGSGERGTDLELLKIHGLPKLIEQGQQFPAIVVSPQCPANQWWNIKELEAMVKEIKQKYKVDNRRVYLTGLSMGGYGTWELGIAHPRWFAALAPICGGGNEARVHRIKNVPVWVFHGAKDMVVKPSESEKMVNALLQVNGNVRYTLYPEATHDSWTETYQNPDFFKWLFAQKR